MNNADHGLTQTPTLANVPRDRSFASANHPREKRQLPGQLHYIRQRKHSLLSRRYHPALNTSLGKNVHNADTKANPRRPLALPGLQECKIVQETFAVPPYAWTLYPCFTTTAGPARSRSRSRTSSLIFPPAGTRHLVRFVTAPRPLGR